VLRRTAGSGNGEGAERNRVLPMQAVGDRLPSEVVRTTAFKRAMFTLARDARLPGRLSENESPICC